MKLKQKSKEPVPAQDLYISTLFRGLRVYAESKADEWFILSAKYGLLRPTKKVEPYECTLNNMKKAERGTWAKKVEHDLLLRLPDRAEIILLAGARYREEIEPFLRAQGYVVSVPFKGLRFGPLLHKLKQINERHTS